MTEVFPSSSQWKHVLFRVQLILADPSIELLRIIKYPAELQQKHLNHMKIDCAINAQNLTENNIEEIKYGNSSRFVFEAGHIKIDYQSNTSSKNQSSISLRSSNVRPKKLLLFKLAIDQSLPIHKSGVSSLSSITQFPAGIDTIYVSDSKEELNIYPHKYRVKDKSQALLQYEVDFVSKGIDGMQKWDPNLALCEYCNVNKAIYYCPQDQQLYCGKCFEQLHRSTKKKAHESRPLSPFNSTTNCSFHSKQRLTHYCLDCMQLQCDECIKNQIHKNDKKHTQIMNLTELQKVLIDKQQTFTKQAKERTKALILKAQSMLAKLTKNYQSQKLDLQQKFTAKLTKIKQESNKKIMRVISLHTQFKRKYDELLWVQNFLHYCEDFLLVEDNIQMKDSFFVYLQNITPRDYYQQAQKNIQSLEI